MDLLESACSLIRGREEGKPISRPHSLAEDGKTQPIDLHHEQTRSRFRRLSEMACGQAPDEDAIVGVVVAHGHELAIARILAAIGQIGVRLDAG